MFSLPKNVLTLGMKFIPGRHNKSFTMMMQAKLKDAVTIMCFGSRTFKVFMLTLDKKNKKTPQLPVV